jgi:hypothetical protein
VDPLVNLQKGEEIIAYILFPDVGQRKWYVCYFMGFLGRTNLAQIRVIVEHRTHYLTIRRECIRKMRLVR